MAAAPPAASVVIPVYNGAGHIGDAVRSALAQDHRPIEVVVVDDGSTDGTAEVVRAIGAPEVVLVQQANAGHGAAKNAGVARSAGTYVAFLDADDVFLPAKLSAQIGHLEAHPDVGFTVCLMRNVIEPAAAEKLTPAQAARLGGTPPAWLPSGLVVRRSTFEAVGPFDETLKHGNDTDWFARAKALGVESAVVDEVLLDRRLHGDNLTHAVEEIHRDVLTVLRASIARRRSQ